MAVTIAAAPANFLSVSQAPRALGSRRCWTGALAADASYPTGGYALDPNLFGLDRADFVICPPNMVVGGTAAYGVWNFTTNRLQFFTPAGVEIANTTNLSASRVVAMIVGH